MKYILSIIALLVFMGCDKNIEVIDTDVANSDSNQTGNKKPKANAGEDKTIKVGKSIDINGTGTDVDGLIVDYEWKEGTVLVSGLKDFTFMSNQDGNHTLTLTVMDDDGATGSDTMVVEVTK